MTIFSERFAFSWQIFMCKKSESLAVFAVVFVVEHGEI